MTEQSTQFATFEIGEVTTDLTSEQVRDLEQQAHLPLPQWNRQKDPILGSKIIASDEGVTNMYVKREYPGARFMIETTIPGAKREQWEADIDVIRAIVPLKEPDSDL